MLETRARADFNKRQADAEAARKRKEAERRAAAADERHAELLRQRQLAKEAKARAAQVRCCCPEAPQTDPQPFPTRGQTHAATRARS